MAGVTGRGLVGMIAAMAVGLAAGEPGVARAAPAPFAPANLSQAKAITFWARGQGPAFAVFASSNGTPRPASAPFTVEPEWKRVTVPFDDIKGFDPHAANMLAIIATTTPGDFRLEIADVRLTSP